MTRVFFTDRDLGKQFPAILRSAGILVEAHADHFASNAPDDQWLPEVGSRGWIVLTHDQRIRYKTNERDAVMAHNIGMIVLIGKVPHPELARAFIASIQRVEAFLDRNAPPLIAKLYRAASRSPGAGYGPGRIELWLSQLEWPGR